MSLELVRDFGRGRRCQVLHIVAQLVEPAFNRNLDDGPSIAINYVLGLFDSAEGLLHLMKLSDERPSVERRLAKPL